MAAAAALGFSYAQSSLIDSSALGRSSVNPGNVPVALCPPCWPWADTRRQRSGGLVDPPRTRCPGQDVSFCLSGYPTARQTRSTIKCLPTLPRTSSMRTWSAMRSSVPNGKWSVQRKNWGCGCRRRKQRGVCAAEITALPPLEQGGPAPAPTPGCCHALGRVERWAGFSPSYQLVKTFLGWR